MDLQQDKLEHQQSAAIILDPAATAGAGHADEAFDHFMEAAEGLVRRLRERDEELSQLARITERINYGVMLEEILEYVYREIRAVIPYNRIGFSLIQEGRGVVAARWAHSDRPMKLTAGYEAPLAGSTLSSILQTGRPRIINDLPGYLQGKPQSESTRLVVEEGMRSSLTCPLVVQGKPVGFLFFSSQDRATYSRAHIGFFQQIAGQLSSIVEKGRLYSELAQQKEIIQTQHEELKRDLEMARKVQRVMIPRQVPAVAGLEIAWDYKPVMQVGGDVLDVIELGGRGALLFIGDAMGHGVQAALVMSVVKTALRNAAAAEPAPEKVLWAINRVICEMLGDGFVTAAACLLDAAGGRCDVSLAGHARPFIFRAGSGKLDRPGEAALPLGVAAEGAYTCHSVHLEAGDVLVLNTDGIVEAARGPEELYGEERLGEQIRLHGCGPAGELVGAVMEDVRRFCPDKPQEDDFTMLVARRMG